MTRIVLAGSALALILLVSVIRVAFADVGPGVLFDVQYPSGGGVPRETEGADQTFFIVVPGGQYRAVITNVECTGTVDVWIKGKNTDGTPWVIELDDQTVTGGNVTTDVFTIPETAGCTIQVAYSKQGHETANPTGPGTGHMKTYGDDEEPFGNPVPCAGVVVPEFPLLIKIVFDGNVPEFPIGPEVIAALGLLAFYAIRRKQKP